MTNFINSIFNPVINFLDLMIGKLSDAGTIAAQGIRLDHYLGFLSFAGPHWVMVIQNFLAALIFLFILYMVQKYSRILLWLKDLIKWW